MDRMDFKRFVEACSHAFQHFEHIQYHRPSRVFNHGSRQMHALHELNVALEHFKNVVFTDSPKKSDDPSMEAHLQVGRDRDPEWYSVTLVPRVHVMEMTPREASRFAHFGHL